ncbi:MAG: polymer-forming cytoskeletal protein [Bacteroidetes bacterium]|jgi:cytoskeletal protein CcmA (bactofilin family)|nr:polymer-forming cytoskeletal protein [Bacteroidota bacterium]
MFSNKKKENSEALDARNHVAQGTLMKGTLTSQGGLRIDGKVEGDIEAIGKLVIGEKGEVIGNITCKDAEIEGKVSGTINSSGLIYFKPTATMEGELSAHSMKMDPGAVYIGSLDMRSAKQNAAQLNGKADRVPEKGKVAH